MVALFPCPDTTGTTTSNLVAAIAPNAASYPINTQWSVTATCTGGTAPVTETIEQSTDGGVTWVPSATFGTEGTPQTILVRVTCTDSTGATDTATTTVTITECVDIAGTIDPAIDPTCAGIITDVVGKMDRLICNCFDTPLAIDFDYMTQTQIDTFGAGVLAVGGPSSTQGGRGLNGQTLPIVGGVSFNPTTDALCASDPNRYREIVIHEILHVLGFNSSTFNSNNLTNAAGEFIGANVQQTYGQLLGTNTPTPAPMDGSHWDESIFGNELMSPALDNPSQFSALTMAALEDMGYCVDPTECLEPYTLPNSPVLDCVLPNPWGIANDQYTRLENLTMAQINAASPGGDPALNPDITFNPSDNKYTNGSTPQIAQFRFQGAPSHYCKDDPVVFPNQSGASHLHMFYGNTAADAFSTAGDGGPNDLLNIGGSTVQGFAGANRSAYWMPALHDGPLGGPGNERNVIIPEGILVYYKSGRWCDVQEIPAGLQLIGGNINPAGPMVHNLSWTGFNVNYQWGFYNPTLGLIVETQNTIPTSNPNNWDLIRCVIGFPQHIQVDGNGDPILSSANHLSHSLATTNPQGGLADNDPSPASHPYRIPHIQILVDFKWPSNGDTSGWRLSSDLGQMTMPQVPNPGGSLHADILFAWNPLINQLWTTGCFECADPHNCSEGQLGAQAYTGLPEARNLDRITGGSGSIQNQHFRPANEADYYVQDPFDI